MQYDRKDYKNFIPLAGQKNKPNSNPIKPNLQKDKMNVNSFITKNYRKKDDFSVWINKPNFVKGPKWTQVSFHKWIMKINTIGHLVKTNPIKPNLYSCRRVTKKCLLAKQQKNPWDLCRPLLQCFPENLRAYSNNRLVMRSSEKFEAKAAGQKCSEAWLLHVENIFGRQRRHRALEPAAIEWVIRIRS